MPRAGSRKAQVYSAFRSGGAEAANKIGQELSLAVGTVRSWIGGWSKEQPTKLEAPAPVDPKAPRKRGSRWNGQRVRVLTNSMGVENKGQLGTIIEKTDDSAWPFRVQLDSGLNSMLDEWEFEKVTGDEHAKEKAATGRNVRVR